MGDFSFKLLSIYVYVQRYTNCGYTKMVPMWFLIHVYIFTDYPSNEDNELIIISNYIAMNKKLNGKNETV